MRATRKMWLVVFLKITKVMHRKNFWYHQPLSLHEHRTQAHKLRGRTVSPSLNRAFAVCLLLIGVWCATTAPLAWGQEEITRKVKSKVAPVYPELAKRMNLTGVVKVMITVNSNGLVKNAKLVGGHPVLANAALEAVKKWRFESAAQESSGTVEFRFDSAQ